MLTDPRLLLDMTCEAGQLWPLVSFFQLDTGFMMLPHLIAITDIHLLLDDDPIAIVFDHSRHCVTPIS